MSSFVPATPDRWRNTRTVDAGPVARFFFAPHGVNHHLEHHLLMTVPSYQLPRMRQLLRERGALEGTPQASGYVEVLQQAAGRA